jgi:hypothetical protein
MSVFYERIRTVIDPEQADASPDGVVHQDVSVIMTQGPGPVAPERRLEAAVVTLSGAEARELAFELLGAAEAAERVGGRR